MKKITSWAEIQYQVLLEAWLKSAKNSLRERRYNIGDMYVVDVFLRRRTELVCSAASVLIFRSDPYSELLKESQQVVWLHW